ncbi:MAG: hypothetical protein AAB131_15840 [Actinomycetota bacterium]|nr:MAG: hypothetical protein FD127_3472 [Acidimicrobiaceae bacterium]
MSSDERLDVILRAIQASDDGDAPADNAILAAELGWSLVDVALCLDEAKERALIWGHRGGTKPGPWFSELEVTVQGRRFLSARP